ncbi:MAG: SH3 domain-containing protein [Candidatus Didemnitutus sp.]|nr:SH3 domain-containing protein [Candidatus Didemnitutus sp.]
MKTKLSFLALAFAWSGLALTAETLTADTAVFQQADASSPVISQLKRGAPVETVGDAPAGWRRVAITGTFEAFVHSRDISKSLEVREGASMLTAPSKTAPQLSVAQKDDVTEITGLRGDYCQIKVTKRLEGFIALPSMANRPADSTPAIAITQPIAAPAVPVATPASVGRAVPTGNMADLPRLFSGTLVVARRPLLNPNPPYEYQLTDLSGRRFAYVDTKRLVLTNRLESYVDKIVTVTGTVRNTVDGKDLVVVAEAIQVK